MALDFFPMAKLAQVLAVEMQIKSTVYATVTSLRKAMEKPTLVAGHVKYFTPRNDDGEEHPAESQLVQLNATFVPGSDVITTVTSSLTQLFDVVATKDWANCNAKADVIVDGKVVLKGAPATYLLFLSKQLTDLKTFMTAVPELDPANQWSSVPEKASGLYKTEIVKSQRTVKKQKPIVLHQPTKEHPAQTALITEDEIVGTWSKTLFSGAIAPVRKKEILKRIELVFHAVKFALEEANAIAVEDKRPGRELMDFLFA